MPKVSFSLVEQFSDLRSKELSYKFLIENQGATRINVAAITPRIPDQVQLVEAKNPSLRAVAVQYEQICADIGEIIRTFLIVEVKDFQDRVIKANQELAREFMGSISTYFRVMLRVMRGGLKPTIDIIRVRTQSLAVQIRNRDDAVSVMDTFMGSVADTNTVKQIIKEKIRQLADLENHGVLNPQSAAARLAIIEPESFFAITYILRFPRSVMNPKKYNLEVEAAYSEDNKEERHVGGATSFGYNQSKPICIDDDCNICGVPRCNLKENYVINVIRSIVRPLNKGLPFGPSLGRGNHCSSIF